MYEDDEYSRQMLGKADSVSIAKNEHKQKRLILCNLHELYSAFKKRNIQMLKWGFQSLLSYDLSGVFLQDQLVLILCACVAYTKMPNF